MTSTFRYEQVPDAWVAKLSEHFHILWRELRLALADVAPLIIDYTRTRYAKKKKKTF